MPPAPTRVIASPARTKNVHRAGRVSGGLLNPSRWGAVTDPGTHPFSHKEKTNSIIISRAATKFALTISKKVSPREAEPFTRLMLDSPDHDSRFSFLPRLPA